MMHLLPLFKKMYLRKSVSIAAYCAILLLVYYGIFGYLEIAEKYWASSGGQQDRQAFSVSIAILYQGIRIFLIVLFVAAGAYSHMYKIRQNKFLSCFGYPKSVLCKINALALLFEVLLPDFLTAIIGPPLLPWLLRHFQRRFPVTGGVSAGPLLEIQLFLFLYYAISLIYLTFRPVTRRNTSFS